MIKETATSSTRKGTPAVVLPSHTLQMLAAPAGSAAAETSGFHCPSAAGHLHLVDTCRRPAQIKHAPHLPAAKKYAAFVASETVIKQIPRLLGPGLNKAGKFPSLVSHSDDLQTKVGRPSTDPSVAAHLNRWHTATSSRLAHSCSLQSNTGLQGLFGATLSRFQSVFRVCHPSC